ncbi:GNAT family N-acetyltransferase [Streptomyces sp. AJS327]|uniref:GNAT family N-acetyltransferase n=1 Tax=Streptomyces sp. AJS327 TaxID=2545265 RepID=UPI0015DF3FF2|nr:GNAT family N-acetyltransferase [Streptomyces sp. AJS327]MBA0053400.1 GNAT family N-acetyltransferase [Streptomyces sp. AJS327]
MTTLSEPGDGPPGGRPSLRAARPEEAGELTELALRSKGHWGYDADFLAACRAELTLLPGEVTSRRTTVLEEGGRVLGFTTLEGEPPEGVLGMMFLEPAAIGRGLGRVLFTATADEARRLGFRRLEVDADPGAEPFYRAMGAERTGSAPSGSIPGRVLPHLSLTL